MKRGRLAVFAKAPQPGRVKTRLIPVLSPDQAAACYAAMLADVLVASLGFARRLGLEPVLYFDPPDARMDFEASVPVGYRLEPQRGTSLAERMANAFADANAEGVAWLILRGSDSPGLDFEPVAAACAWLEAGTDLVVTPDQGGGYALIGMKEPRTELFDLVFSTESVLDETLDRARALGLVTARTAATFDIDRPEDLVLVATLPPDQSSVLCPRTVGFVGALRENHVL